MGMQGLLGETYDWTIAIVEGLMTLSHTQVLTTALETAARRK